MTAKKKHRIIYLTAFCICTFILIDANYSPLKQKANVVLSFECRFPHTYGLKSNNNWKNYIGVKDHTYRIMMLECLPIREEDTIFVSRSAITHALAFLEIHGKEGNYTYDISFVNGKNGKHPVWVVQFLIVLFFIFHDSLGNTTGKRNMTWFLLGCSIVLLIQHIFDFWYTNMG